MLLPAFGGGGGFAARAPSFALPCSNGGASRVPCTGYRPSDCSKRNHRRVRMGHDGREESRRRLEYRQRQSGLAAVQLCRFRLDSRHQDRSWCPTLYVPSTTRPKCRTAREKQISPDCRSHRSRLTFRPPRYCSVNVTTTRSARPRDCPWRP